MKSGPVTYVEIFRPFPHPRVIIFIMQNDPKMKSVTMLFAQIRLKNAHKIDTKFNSEYISLLSFADFSILVPHFLYVRISNFMFLGFFFI
jgi:hypothetical protein